MQDLINKIIRKIIAIGDIQVLFDNRKLNIHGVDGKLTIIHKGSVCPYDVKIKKNFRIIHLSYLEVFNKELKNFLLFSEYITPPLREELKRKGIFYADACGNMFLKSKTFYFYINGKKNINADSIRRNKCFGSAGLKLIFNLLVNDAIINKSYRDISEITKLSLDTISRVFKELEQQKFIINVNKNYKKLYRKKELFEKWVSYYSEILKPKIIRGKYRALDNDFTALWKSVNINCKKTKWGGEPAADLMTNYLRPEYFTVYTQENDEELLNNYKFISDPNGNIEVTDKFWFDENINFYNNINNQLIVHPFLIYADLVYSNNPRNYETANLIFKEYIDEYISET